MYTAINLYTFFLVFSKFLLILTLNKLVNSYIFQPDKAVMHRLLIKYIVCYSRAISSLDIGNFVGVPHSFFSNFSLYSNVYINFYEYVNVTTGIYYH